MQDFIRKRNALFASLDDASKELKGTPLDQSGKDCRATELLKRCGEGGTDLPNTCTILANTVGDQHKTFLSPKRSLSRLRGKESIFKKPELPISKCLKPRKTPDYQINPHKWKKYTLSDVDISDETNNRAAFAFLTEIDEQRAAQDAEREEETNTCNEGKIQFKKLSIIKRQIMTRSTELADAEIDKPKQKGAKFVMPEYVVGQHLKTKKKQAERSDVQKRTTSGDCSERQLHLSHLQDYDDGEEEPQVILIKK